MFILNDFWKQKMEFLTMDKIFVLDNFKIVLDKKYFVQADGWGICTKIIDGLYCWSSNQQRARKLMTVVPRINGKVYGALISILVEISLVKQAQWSSW